MAQKTEKEETEFKVPEALTLCVNNCGLIGNPATNNMCQKCFNATTASTSSSSSSAAAAAAVSSKSGDAVLCGGPIRKKSPRSGSMRSPRRSGSSPASPTPPCLSGEIAAEVSEKKVVSRCSNCRRKVGLTGFRCRCGELFCGEHRYSDRHDCSYDYKAAGREAIARENPVVKAAKIVRL